MVQADTNALRLEIKEITKRFPGTLALDRVSFDLQSGDIHALVGENGAGKSTLIKVLTGIHHPDGGQIFINGKPVTLNSPRDAEALGIAVVYQDVTLIPEFTALENIFLGHELTDVLGQPNWQKMRRQALKRLNELGVTMDLDTPVEDLSRSNQQIVMIARALSRQMRILILDEVTGAIPREEEEHLFEVVRRLQVQEHVAIIYITHQLEEVLNLATRVTVLANGRKVAAFAEGEFDTDALVKALIKDQERRTEQIKHKHEPGQAALRLTNLAGDEVEDISLTVREGEVVGVTGLLGSGKESMARLLFGITPRLAGEIELFGEPVDIQHPHDAIEQGIFLVPEDRQTQGLIAQMSSQENLTLSRLRRIAGWFGLIQPRRERSLAQKYVDELGIVLSGLNRSVRTLSGGNQQRVVIGKGLFTESRVYIFVSPTHGVDIGARQDIYKLIRRLCEEEKAAILLISSEIFEIQAVSDRIVVIRDGRVSAELKSSEASQQNILRHFWN